MVYPSTAKQRLWLTCLGYTVADSASGDEVRALFEDRARFSEPPNQLQRQLAARVGVKFAEAETRNDAGGRLYQLLLLCAWVFSVWRSLRGGDFARHHSAGLPEPTALAIAREVLAAGLGEVVNEVATTDACEGDVWFRLSKAAGSSPAFRFTAARRPNGRVGRHQEPAR